MGWCDTVGRAVGFCIVLATQFPANAQSQVYGAIAIGEFTVDVRGLASWAWIDSSSEYHAQLMAFRLCSTVQPNPYSVFRQASLPQACRVTVFRDAAAIVAYTVDGRLYHTQAHGGARADVAAFYALGEACNHVPAGTPVTVHWARNSHSPYPQAWNQEYRHYTASKYDGHLVCNVHLPGTGGQG